MAPRASTLRSWVPSGTTRCSSRSTGTPALAMCAAIPPPITPAPSTAARRISIGSDRFEHGGDPLAATDAHGRQRQRFALALQERRSLAGDPGPAGAQRMPERDGAAVEIEAALVDAQRADDGQRLRSERLVDASIRSMSSSRTPARSSAFRAAVTGPIRRECRRRPRRPPAAPPRRAPGRRRGASPGRRLRSARRAASPTRPTPASHWRRRVWSIG